MQNTQGLACAYCGAEGVALQRDHVVPRSRGGPDIAANLVMACVPCNLAKSDSLASEWLGEQCPQRILDIERRMDNKLGSDFRKRDRHKFKPERGEEDAQDCGFSIVENGNVGFIGYVHKIEGDFVWLEILDIISWYAGWWNSSREIRRIPFSECRLFVSLQACHDAAQRIADRYFVCSRHEGRVEYDFASGSDGKSPERRQKPV